MVIHSPNDVVCSATTILAVSYVLLFAGDVNRNRHVRARNYLEYGNVRKYEQEQCDYHPKNKYK